MSKEKEQKINLYDYTFEPGTKIEIDAELFEATLATLTLVQEQETIRVLLNEQANALGKNKLEYTPYDAKSFFTQEPKLATTLIGASVMDIKYNFFQVFAENIKAGKAVKKQELREKTTDDLQISQ